MSEQEFEQKVTDAIAKLEKAINQKVEIDYENDYSSSDFWLYDPATKIFRWPLDTEPSEKTAYAKHKFNDANDVDQLVFACGFNLENDDEQFAFAGVIESEPDRICFSRPYTDMRDGEAGTDDVEKWIELCVSQLTE